MSWISKIIAALVVTTASMAANAAPTELLQNGGFETGDLTGWNTSTTLAVRCCENNSPDGTFVASFGSNGAALSGTYSAYGDFDGSGPDSILLSQSFNKSGTFSDADLSFMYSAEVMSRGIPRNLSVSFVQGLNSVTVYSLDFIDSGIFNFGQPRVGHVGVNVTSALNSFSNGAITMVVNRYVPEDFTGPGTFAADNFSLSASTIAPVPEPESYAMLMAGLGVMGFVARRRKQK